MKKIAVAVLCFVLIMLSAGYLRAQSDKATALATGFATGAYEISDYNTACYFALTGNKKLALTYLKKSLKDGFNRPKTMLEDSDLFSLHDEPEWSSLVDLAKENESKNTTKSTLFFNQPGFWESKFFKTP